MILTEREWAIIKNMKHPSIRIKEEDESYKDLSDDELISLIGKMDDYINEFGETQREFGNYDEFYILELTSIKTYLIEEYQNRKIMLKMKNDKFDIYRKEYNDMIRNAVNHKKYKEKRYL